MGYLKSSELATCAMVSRKFWRISEENNLWEELARSEATFSTYSKLHPPQQYDLPHGYWKKYYLDMMNLITPSFSYLAAIVGRKGTNDEWFDHFGSWKAYYTEELAKRGLVLNSMGQILWKKIVIGHYKFLTKEQVEPKYAKSRWWADLEKNIEECPYIANIVGFITFQPSNRHVVDLELAYFYESHKTESCQQWLIQEIIHSARGVIVRTDLPDCYLLCIRRTRILAGELVNRDDGFSGVGLVVDPHSAKGTVKYLSDLVDLLNKKIKKFLAKESEKKAALQRGFRTFVEVFQPYSKVYYPFQLEDYPIFQYLNEHWITIWAHPNDKSGYNDETYNTLVLCKPDVY
jgi:hypothetical protein